MKEVTITEEFPVGDLTDDMIETVFWTAFKKFTNAMKARDFEATARWKNIMARSNEAIGRARVYRYSRKRAREILAGLLTVNRTFRVSDKEQSK